MRRIWFALLFVAVAASSNACSVYMAAVGDEEPNISNVRKGATRGEVELALGQPKSISLDQQGNTIAMYEYTLGNEPSPGRAIAYTVLDVLTLGIWEIFGTPIEAFNQGKKVEVTVHYDKEQVVTEIQSNKKSSA
jgi:hypothetical protein